MTVNQPTATGYRRRNSSAPHTAVISSHDTASEANESLP